MGASILPTEVMEFLPINYNSNKKIHLIMKGFIFPSSSFGESARNRINLMLEKFSSLNIDLKVSINESTIPENQSMFYEGR